MEVNKIYEGSCLNVIKTFPDKSIDCVITSPPYWQLRDYGWSGQWGMERTFQEYLEHLWLLIDEVWRVLKDTGTVWVNLGDTYGTKSGIFTGGNTIANKISYTGNMGNDYCKDANYHKCLLLIPHRFAIGCIDRGWIMRNDVIWGKRNGMPESVTDRFSKKHEYFFFMVKSEKYYFDLKSISDSIKEVSKKRYQYSFTVQEGGTSGNFKGDKTHLIHTTKIPSENSEMFGSPRAREHRKSNGKSVFGGKKGDGQDVNGIYSGKEWFPNDGKNPGSVSDFWDITTKPSSESHYASFNTELIDKPIIAGCPIGGIILDPFCGTATTGCRAIDLQRKFIGIEGKPEYVKIGNKKLLPFQISQQLF